MNMELLSSLHDGRLHSISVDDSHGVTLVCRVVGGQVVKIRLGDVMDFCADNFRSGNVILDVEVHSSSSALDDDALRRLAHSARPDHVQAYRARLQNEDASGALRYFVLHSSYGCEAVAVVRGEIAVELAVEGAQAVVARS